MRYAVLLVCSSCLLPTREAEPPPPDGATTRTRGVFVTRGRYTGALTSYVGLDDGLAAGDAICQLRAKAAGLPGTWVAWLSSADVDAVARITAQGPWRLVGGEVAFANRPALHAEPLVALDRDEHGDLVDEHVTIGTYVWTGTRGGGQRHGDTCGSWTSDAGLGLYGAKSRSFHWTDSGSRFCSDEHHLVCFEN